MKCAILAAVAALALVAGCGGVEPANQPARQPDAASNRLPPPSAPVTVREPAKPGVGEKGRGLDVGPVSTPIKALFSTKERLAFLQIVQPMNIYKVEHGHFPKTQEEFMAKIIKENGIPLPELPAGSRYVYDAKKAAAMSSYDPDDPPLMVERPQ
jgi:hypothetical protein